MKSFVYVAALLAGLTAATPIESHPALVEREARENLEKTGVFDLKIRQSTGTTANDLVNGACKEVIFIWARGSTEPGNLGDGTGPALVDALKAQLGTANLAVQGVDYAASLATNLIGGDPKGIAEMQRLWTLANSKCPNSIVIGGGYSQGAALTHKSIPPTSAAIRNQIQGILLFGDTQRQQTNGAISGLTQSKLLIICNSGDLVCEGTLVVRQPHLEYVPRVPEAARFLVGRVNAARAARVAGGDSTGLLGAVGSLVGGVTDGVGGLLSGGQ